MTDLREYFKQWPRFYYFVGLIFGPMLLCGLSSKKFLVKYPTNGKIINLGSGPRVLAPHIINIDLHAYPGVQIVASAHTVPLPSASVARIISDNVLEHVKGPVAAVSEMHRLLESNGLVYVATPFIYPFHSSPSDYQRWTQEGLKELFKDFEIIEIGVRAGPFSALDAYLCHLTGLIFSFGSPILNSLFTNLAMFVFLPVKLLDLVFNFWPQAHTMAAILYCVAKKR